MIDDDDDDQLDEGQPPPIEPEPGEAASPRRQRRKKVTAELVERESVRFWRGVLGDAVGRREVWAILHACSCFEERHAAGPSGVPDRDATAYYRGQRDFGLNFYFRLARLDRAGVFAMHDEFDHVRFPQPERRAK